VAAALVIGAGYLGLRAARLWRERQFTVYATTRRPERCRELESAGLCPIVCDVMNPPRDAFPVADVVLYAVGFDRSAGASMREVYVAGLQRTLEVLPAPGRVLYVSSTGVYGDSGGDWVDETTLEQPLDDAGKVCLEAEGVLAKFAARHGTETVVLRLAGLYGPGRLIGAEALRSGRVIAADPEVFLNLIHVTDAARVVIGAAESEAPSRLYLVADGQPVVRREFYQRLAALLHVPAPVFDPTKAPRQRGNRRIRNDRMRRGLKTELLYPDYRAGLEAIVAGAD
jgi:nucleoside-diphosphate-sugar epimerase